MLVQSKSQVGQDQWVLSFLKDADTYVEIGANHPVVINNTFELECRGWKGVSIDVESGWKEHWANARKNPLIIADAVTVDWINLLKNCDWAGSKLIGYMSFDVDDFARPAFDNFPWREYRFKTMTIEHDSYRFGDEFKNHERRVLSELGYILEKPDVKCGDFIFEDWWVSSDLQS